MIEKLTMNPFNLSAPTEALKPSVSGATEISKQFSSFLNDAMEKTAAQKIEVDKLSEQFIKGDSIDIHELMIASEKASIGLELTVQVRNKAVEAYQEIMRIQI